LSLRAFLNRLIKYAVINRSARMSQ
jgi:hypothetical protein